MSLSPEAMDAYNYALRTHGAQMPGARDTRTIEQNQSSSGNLTMPRPSDFGLPYNVEDTLEEKRREFDKSKIREYREEHKKRWLPAISAALFSALPQSESIL